MFVSYPKASRDQIVSIPTAERLMETKRRRLYDVINILEGIGLVEKVPSPSGERGTGTYHWTGSISSVRSTGCLRAEGSYYPAQQQSKVSHELGSYAGQCDTTFKNNTVLHEEVAKVDQWIDLLQKRGAKMKRNNGNNLALPITECKRLFGVDHAVLAIPTAAGSLLGLPDRQPQMNGLHAFSIATPPRSSGIRLPSHGLLMRTPDEPAVRMSLSDDRAPATPKPTRRTKRVGTAKRTASRRKRVGRNTTLVTTRNTKGLSKSTQQATDTQSTESVVATIGAVASKRTKRTATRSKRQASQLRQAPVTKKTRLSDNDNIQEDGEPRVSATLPAANVWSGNREHEHVADQAKPTMAENRRNDTQPSATATMAMESLAECRPNKVVRKLQCSYLDWPELPGAKEKKTDSELLLKPTPQMLQAVKKPRFAGVNLGMPAPTHESASKTIKSPPTYGTKANCASLVTDESGVVPTEGLGSNIGEHLHSATPVDAMGRMQLSITSRSTKMMLSQPPGQVGVDPNHIEGETRSDTEVLKKPSLVAHTSASRHLIQSDAGLADQLRQRNLPFVLPSQRSGPGLDSFHAERQVTTRDEDMPIPPVLEARFSEFSFTNIAILPPLMRQTTSMDISAIIPHDDAPMLCRRQSSTEFTYLSRQTSTDFVSTYSMS